MFQVKKVLRMISFLTFGTQKYNSVHEYGSHLFVPACSSFIHFYIVITNLRYNQSPSSILVYYLHLHLYCLMVMSWWFQTGYSSTIKMATVISHIRPLYHIISFEWSHFDIHYRQFVHQFISSMADTNLMDSLSQKSTKKKSYNVLRVLRRRTSRMWW